MMCNPSIAVDYNRLLRDMVNFSFMYIHCKEVRQ